MTEKVARMINTLNIRLIYKVNLCLASTDLDKFSSGDL